MSVANSYAKALYEAAVEGSSPQNVTEVLNQAEVQLNLFLDVLNGSKEIQVALLSPVTSAREKGAVVREVGKKIGATPLLIEFLNLLARKGRLSLFAAIQEAFS